MHLVTRVHFRSRDKDGGHTIRSPIVKTPKLHTSLVALCVIEAVMADHSFTLREYEFSTFLAPVTLILTRHIGT